MFEAPQQRCSPVPRGSGGRSEQRVAALATAPIGIANGSMITSCARNAVAFGALDDLLGDREALVRVLGNAGLVVGDADDGRLVLRHHRQHHLQSLLLAGDRVDQRLALVRRQARLERRDDR